MSRAHRISGGSEPHYARRHTFTLEAPAYVRVEMDSAASNPRPLDTYLLLLRGRVPATQVIARNNDAWVSTDNSRISSGRLGPGDYTIEATTNLAGHTGGYDLDVRTRLGAIIKGLDDTTAYGNGTVAVSDEFTVEPPNAPCHSAAGTITPATGATRTVTADVPAGTTTAVTVSCKVPLAPWSSASAQFAARRAVESLIVRVVDGGRCEREATVPSGVDAAYECSVADDALLVLSVVADASVYGPSFGWLTSGGVRRVRSTQSQRPSLLVAPDGALGGWRRTGTVTLSCTAAGVATLSVSVPGAPDYVAVVEVACEDQVPHRGPVGHHTGRHRHGDRQRRLHRGACGGVVHGYRYCGHACGHCGHRRGAHSQPGRADGSLGGCDGDLHSSRLGRPRRDGGVRGAHRGPLRGRDGHAGSRHHDPHGHHRR